jgi:SecD/SecF fusion protein
MQNKGAISLFAIALAVVCLFQLSFTWVTSRVNNDAKIFADNYIQKVITDKKIFSDPSKKDYVDSLRSSMENQYIDSISSETVFNIGVKKYTYRECTEREINLGLDLKGGMNVVLEVSVVDVVRSLSNYSTDTTFVKAINQAKIDQEKSQDDFVTLFGKAFEKIDPNAKLAAIFSTVELKEKVKFNSTNREVLSVLSKETSDAIDNSFNILRSRIDKFGVVQPNIQQLETKGRILVELPGIKEPERVRKLLQGTANLEFWETYENQEVYQYLLAANQKIKELEAAPANSADTTNAKVATSDLKSKVKSDSTNKALSLLNKIEKADTLKNDSTARGNKMMKEYPLFSVLQPNAYQNQIAPGCVIGRAHIKDTAKVDRYLNLKQVRSLFPRDIRFYWSMKTIKSDKTKSILELNAIKASGRDGRPPLDGSVITSARKEFGQNKAEANVTMSMNSEGSKIWARITKDNVGRCVAVVLDGYVASNPRVNQEISGGNTQITGDFTISEAEDLANILKCGKVPAPARIIEESTVGPTLGKEAISAGLGSFIIAFIGVLLYMWLYYGRAGNVANIALFANVFFLFGVFASMGLVLTLPGIAGIVLTLAMAVDGNVIIYERMREESRAGKAPRSIVKDGFHHAYSAIIDGHVTTILTGVVLWLFGSGPVQGFATSLIVGLLLSLFSSIFIARLMFEWMLNRDMHITLGNRFTINAMTKVKIDFIGLRKKMYVVSSVIILTGIVSLFVRGLDPSVEFTGGRTYVVRFDKVVSTTDIRESLTKSFNDAPEVKTFGSHDDQVKITTKYLIDNKSAQTDSIVNHKLYEGLKGHYKAPISYNEFAGGNVSKKIGEMSAHKVDPVVSNKLIKQAFLAVFFGLIIIFIYIAIRFRNWKYGLGGLVSLAHDTLIVIGCFSLFYKILPFSLEIGQDFIAALLTIIGYSIMDTVIIYDRIREYKQLYPTRALDVNINDAINHTLGRTINTSGITVVVLVIIFIFGGEILRGFIFALLVGVVIGTYSSVFNATPVAYDIIRLTEKKKIKK